MHLRRALCRLGLRRYRPPMANDDIDHIAQTAITAYQRGDFDGARLGFRRVAAAGRAAPQLWLYLALCCEKVGDEGGMETALDRILADEPRHLYALTMKGALLTRRGDDRAAVSFYQLALNNVPAAGALPADLAARLGAAEAAVAAAARRFRAHLESHLAAQAVDVAEQTPRFREALDILSGEKPMFVQQPTNFYYPGLPQNPFFDPAGFGWAASMEAAAPAIRAELEAVLGAETGLEPYVKAEDGRPNRGHALLGDPRWSAYHLFDGGEWHADHAARCPATMAALSRVPMPRIGIRSPSAFFSVLRPHTHIPAHNGMLNTRLICHLPLIVPADCRLRVGNEIRTVESGTLMIFDDSIEHEAWNDSDETRTVLIFEIWRPELSAQEQIALTALFEASGSYGAIG